MQQGEIRGPVIKEVEKHNSPSFKFSTASAKHKIYIQLSQKKTRLWVLVPTTDWQHVYRWGVNLPDDDDLAQWGSTVPTTFKMLDINDKADIIWVEKAQRN